MGADEQALLRYQFSPRIDLPDTLTALDIEYLDVSRSRMIVIYTRAILNIEIGDGRLHNARTVDIEVLDHPPKAGGDDARELIEMIIDRIATTGESDYQEIS